MKLLSVSGAHRGVGKTTFARLLSARLPGPAITIKVGHGTDREKPELLVHSLGEALERIRSLETTPGGPAYAILETNASWVHPAPAVRVFIESPFAGEAGESRSKPSASGARRRADVIVGEHPAFLPHGRISPKDRRALDGAIGEFLGSRRADVTPVILAGGAGRRLGGLSKALIRLGGGQSLLERKLEQVGGLGGATPVVVANDVSGFPAGAYRVVKDAVADAVADAGALVGLYSGLLASSTEWSFVTACDMPFFSVPLFSRIAAGRYCADIVVARVGPYFEPLYAAYRKSCLDRIRELLRGGERRVMSFYEGLRLHVVEEAEVRELDPDLDFLVNINTPKDLELVRQRL